MYQPVVLNTGQMTGFDHVLVVVGSMLCHYAVLHFVRFRKAAAAVVGGAPPPRASPAWWVAFGGAFVAVTLGLIAAARAGAFDVGWFFLVAVFVNLATNVDAFVWSRRIARHIRRGDG